MPKYLIQASYTAEGVQGLLKDGGSKRRAAAEQAIKGLGGRLEAFYFAFGDTDVFAIADAPDNMSAAAVSLGRDRQRRRARQDNGSYDPGGNGSGDAEERELPPAPEGNAGLRRHCERRASLGARGVSGSPALGRKFTERSPYGEGG